MRLLIVANGFPPTAFGGVEIYCYEIARGLRSRGHQVLVFCRESDPARPDYSLIRDEYEGIPVVRLVNDFKRPGAFRASYADSQVDLIFKQVVDEFRPDLVHYNHWIALSTGLPGVTRRGAVPSVLSQHDYWSICHRVNLITGDSDVCPGRCAPGDCYHCVFHQPSHGSRRYHLARLLKPFLPLDYRIRLIRRLGLPWDFGLITKAGPRDFAERSRSFAHAFQQVDQILTPSVFVRDTLRDNGINMDDAQVLPLGVGMQPQPRERSANGPIRFAFVGTVLPIKGTDCLVRAFRAVPADNICLDVYGREDLQPFFTHHVHELAAQDPRIAFHGSFPPDHRAEIYAKMDVLVIPSVAQETFSFVAREALLAGVPVVAARVGALMEIIYEGKNGFLYPAADEGALSAIIARIARQPALLESLVLPGPVEILDTHEHIRRLEQVYQTAVASKVNAVQ